MVLVATNIGKRAGLCEGSWRASVGVVLQLLCGKMKDGVDKITALQTNAVVIPLHGKRATTSTHAVVIAHSEGEKEKRNTPDR